MKKPKKYFTLVDEEIRSPTISTFQLIQVWLVEYTDGYCIKNVEVNTLEDTFPYKMEFNNEVEISNNDIT